MNYGLYLSASGVLTNMYRQDVFANNLANAHTVGFKPDLPAITQREPESIEGGFGMELRHRLLDALGGGVFAGPQRIDFTPGAPQQTGDELDVMLDGEDAFFVVEDATANGDPRLRLTRDGRFQVDAEGFLALTTGGQRVLDAQDQPIQVGRGRRPVITDTGQVMHNGEEVARVQITGVADRAALTKAGGNLFAFDADANQRVPAGNASVTPGFLESSAADPIKTMMKMVEAAKDVTSNGNMIRYHDLLMDRAVNVLGRVVA
jgi:flagellar basal body rod protein FlgG